MTAGEKRRYRRKPKPSEEGNKSRLQRWLDANGFTSVQLEEATGIGRQAMTKIRAGGDTRKRTMVRIRRGCSILAKRKVGIEEIFDLEPEDWAGWPEDGADWPE